MQNKKPSPSLAYVPARRSYASLVRAAKGCEACPLYAKAPWAPKLVATYHPSALLRMMRDPEPYERAKAELEDDLRKAASLMKLGPLSAPRSGAAPTSRTAGSRARLHR